MAKVNVTFTGDVITVHVWVAGDEVPLVYDGTKWSGSREVEPWPMTVRMRFIAPTGTAWSLVVKRAAKKALEETDTSESQIVDKTWVVGDAPAATLVQDVQGLKAGSAAALKTLSVNSNESKAAAKKAVAKKGGNK